MIWRVQTQPVVSDSAMELCAHLASRFDGQWTSFRKEFRRCRKYFSEDNIHDLRVAARRLRATLGLLRDLVPGRDVEQSDRYLKKMFKTLAPLRENQVQLDCLEKLPRSTPEAAKFRIYLQKNERDLRKRARKKMKARKLTELGESIAAVVSWLDKLSKNASSREICLSRVQSALRDKYLDAVTMAGKIDPAKPATIHHTRLAFKRFRYVFESLHPSVVKIPKAQLAAMDHYQTMMGRVQDLEILGQAVRRFLNRKKAAKQGASSLAGKVEKEKLSAIKEFLPSADEIIGFWPEEFIRSAREKNVDSMPAFRQARGVASRFGRTRARSLS